MTEVLIETWQPIAAQWAQQMLLWSWRGLLVLGVTFLIARIWRRGSAAARHQLWLTGLVAVAALPLWTAAAQFLLPFRGPETLTTLVSFPVSVTEAGLQSVGVVVPQEARPSNPQAPQAKSTRGWRAWVVPGAFLAWCAGVLASMAGFFRYCRWARHLRGTAVRVRRVRTPRGLNVAVGYSTAARAPQLAGIRHPMILLPADIEEWSSEEEVRAILLHEMAHLDRRDPYTSVFQALLSAALFFHPAVRFGLGRLRVERELACDEAVAAAGVDRGAYANAILNAAARSIGARQCSVLAFNSPGNILERRVNMILNGHPERERRGLGAASVKVFAALLLAIAACLALPQSQAGAETEQQPASNPAVSVTLEIQESPGPRNFRGGVSGVGRSFVAAAMTHPEPAPQIATADISGRVVDQTGAVIPGVMVRAISGGQAVITAITNPTGAFTLSPLSVGTYEIEVSLPGFRTQRLSVNLGEGGAKLENVTLQIAGLATNVEVTAQRPQPAVPTGAAPPPPPIRVGGDIAQANLIYAPKPAYPPSVRAGGTEGAVLIQAVITVDGTVASPQALSGHPDLVTAALEAIKQWRYRPTLLNGVPIETFTTITINFSLSD